MEDTQTTAATNDPSVKSPLWTTFAPAWMANRDFAEMHEHILRAGTYLDQFGKGGKTLEPTSQYAWRKASSFAMDFAADMVDLRVGNIFRSPPKRSYGGSPHADTIAAFIADVDGAGTSIDEFMRRAVREMYVNGADIVVDRTAPEDDVEVVNLAQEKALGLRAFASMYTPIERINWSADHAGRYLWVRYDLGVEPPEDEFDAVGPRRYLTLTPDSWRLYEVETADNGTTQTSMTEGEIAIGRIPVVPFYFGESSNPDYRKIPVSILTRITPIARAMLNLVSQGQLDIYMAIGILIATGVEAAQLPKEISPNCWLAFPQDATVSNLRPEVAHVAEKREWLAVMTAAMLRMGKVQGQTGDQTARASSGFQVQAERTDLDNEMAATAGRCETIETEVVRLAVARTLGQDVSVKDLGYTVEYNRRFVLSGVDQIIAQAKEFLSLNVTTQVPELARVFVRRILDQLTRPSDTRYQDVVDEITAAQFDATAGPRSFTPLGA